MISALSSPGMYFKSSMQQRYYDDAAYYRAAAPAQVEEVIAESLDGFHQGGAPARCAFVVSGPESRWAERNLLPSMTIEPVPGGLRVVTTTAGVLRLARYVVGLGGVTRIETPELRAAVRELALGALESAAEPNVAVALARPSATSGPVLMAIRSRIARERDLVVGVLGPQVADAHAGALQAQQEVHPLFAAQPRCLPRGQPVHLVELGGQQQLRLGGKLRGRQPEAEEEVVAVLDRHRVGHGSP